MAALKKNRPAALQKFFRSAKDREALENVPLERLQTYRDHVAIGLLGGIQTAFPVLRSLISESEWNGLLNEFYGKRLSRSPIARQVYHEFAHFLEKRYRGPLLKKFPYLGALAHYEDVELKVLHAIDKPRPQIDFTRLEDAGAPASWASLIPILNPHHDLRVYAWPVHRVRRGFSSKQQVKHGAFPLLVFRHEDEVQFLEANVLVAKMLSLMNGKKTLGAILAKLVSPTRTKDPALFVKEAIDAIALLNREGMILGFSRPEGLRGF